MVIAVIGKGMIGAAAARHLALMGEEVLLIGPDEPQDYASHQIGRASCRERVCMFV